MVDRTYPVGMVLTQPHQQRRHQTATGTSRPLHRTHAVATYHSAMTRRDARRALSIAVVTVPVMTIVGWILGLPAWSQADPPPNALVGAAYGAAVGVVISLVAAYVVRIRESLWAAPGPEGDTTAFRAEQRAVRDAVVRTFPTGLTIMAFAAGIGLLSPTPASRLAPAVGLAVVVLLFRSRVSTNRRDLTLED